MVEAIEEDAALLGAFLEGRLDRAWMPGDEALRAAGHEPAVLLKMLADRGVRPLREPRLEMVYDLFNFQDPVLGHAAGERGKAIRRAISLATDDRDIIERLYRGRAQRIDGPIVAGLPEHDPAFVNPWKRGPSESLDAARGRAHKLLEQAGVPLGVGVPKLLVDTADSASDAEAFAAFERDLASIGLAAGRHKASWRDLIRRQRESKFQIVGMSWGADVPAAQNFLQLFYGSHRSPGPNSASYRNPAFDALYERALALPTGPERTALWRQMERIVVDDCVCVFRCQRIQSTLVQPWLTGFRHNEVVPKTFATCRVGPP